MVANPSRPRWTRIEGDAVAADRDGFGRECFEHFEDGAHVGFELHSPVERRGRDGTPTVVADKILGADAAESEVTRRALAHVAVDDLGDGVAEVERRSPARGAELVEPGERGGEILLVEELRCGDTTLSIEG